MVEIQTVQKSLLKFIFKLLDVLINLLEGLSIPTLLAGVGVIPLLASFLLGWYNDGLTVPSTGFMIPILEDSLGHPERTLLSFMNITLGVAKRASQPHPFGFVFLSFGSLALALGVLGGLTMFRFFNFLRIPVGTASLLLGITFVTKLACFHSNLLEPLIDVNTQHTKLIAFSTFNLPPNNLGYEPTFFPEFKTDYLLDRFDAAFYFLSWGWYLTMAGGVLLIGSGLTKESRIEDRSLSSLFYPLSSILFFLLLYSLGLLTPYALAEYRQLKGDNYLAQGNYEQAQMAYLSALRLNSQLFYHPLFRENLGEVYYKLNRKDKVESYIYKGKLLTLEGKVLDTLNTYQQALKLYPFSLSTDSEPAEGISANDPIIKRLLVSLYVQQGFDYFNADHNKYSAIQSWKNALELDPGQLHLYFYIGKAYFDTSNYEQCIAETQTFIIRSTNSLLKANAHSNMGDCYIKLERISEARMAYLRSRSLDRILNNRMTDSLAGGI